MKSHVLLSLITLLLAMMPVTVNGGDGNFSQSRKYNIRVGRKLPGKHAPSNLWIEIQVSGNEIYFYPADWYDEMSVSVTNQSTGDTWNTYITNDQRILLFECCNGLYSVDCITSTGQQLICYFEIVVEE